MRKKLVSEVLIAGGGLVGSLIAIALGQRGFEVILIDPSSETLKEKINFGRAYAISRSSKRLLQNLNIWEKIELNSEHIKKIFLYESDTEKKSLMRLAEFELQNKEEDPMSYMLEHWAFRKALNLELKKIKNIKILTNCKVLTEDVKKSGSIIKLDNEQSCLTSLMVVCDGRKSNIAEEVNKKFISKHYNQIALVANINHDNPHNSVAHQIFYTGGPIAMLPLKGNRSAIVWSEEKNRGIEISNSSNNQFVKELATKIGSVLENISLEGNKFAFPLYLRILRDCVDDRRVFIGDSANTIHPLAGQGLNLGLRDVASLTQTLTEGKRLGEDIGSIGLLKRYERWRSFDRLLLSSFTDGINSLFSNNNNIFRSVRRLGLKTINSSSKIKSVFMNEAAGEYGDLPDLLKELQ